MNELPPVIETRSDVQPRLGIVHLLTWTLGSAIILAVERALNEDSAMEAFGARTYVLTLRAIYAFVTGAALGGVLLFVYRRVRGGPSFPVAPGHWLLLTVGITTIVQITSYPFLIALTSIHGQLLLTVWLILQAVISLISAGLLLTATVRCTAGTRWQVALALLSVTDLLQFVTCGVGLLLGETTAYTPVWPFEVIQWLVLFGGVVVLVTATIDLSQRIAFDWLHHAGVVVWLSLAAASWALSLVSWLSN